VRVLHLTTEYPPVVYGGLGTALGGLTVAQARAGMEVGVLVAGSRAAYGLPAGPFPGSSQITIERRDGLTIFWCDSHEPTELAVRLVRWWKPDVVHLHVFWLAAVAWAIKQETATPLVYHVHSLDKAEYEIGHEASQCLDQWSTQSEIIEAADRVIVLSRSERELLISYVPQVRSRLSIVGNGIDDEVQPLPSRGAKRVERLGLLLLLQVHHSQGVVGGGVVGVDRAGVLEHHLRQLDLRLLEVDAGEQLHRAHVVLVGLEHLLRLAGGGL